MSDWSSGVCSSDLSVSAGAMSVSASPSMMIGGSVTTGGAPSAVANCAFTSGAWADVDSPSAPSRKGHAAGATSPGAAAGSAEAGTTGGGMDAVDDGEREVVRPEEHKSELQSLMRN